jgi:cell division protein FtsI/penicillin-binding protein 2
MNFFKITRIHSAGFLFGMMALLILLQLLRIQTNVNAQILSEQAGERFGYERRRIIPERGAIYDRWGHLLAGNQQVYEVGVALNEVRDPQTIAMVTASLLGLNQADVFAMVSLPYIQGQQEYVVLKDFVSAETIQQLEDLQDQYANAQPHKGQTAPNLNGLHWVGYLQRNYPENSLASNILGFYSFRDRVNGTGYFGVEEKYNELLSGVPLDVILPVDPKEITEVPSVDPGASLVLTIDREVQASVERILDDAVEQNGAVSGTIIVLNPRNNEILAMATTPRLNPNEYWDYAEIFPGSTPYNRAISQTYEPGSTFKVITMASALDAGVVTPETNFLDTGAITVGGITIHNWDGGAWGWQTMTGCMQHSLNVCLSWVATELGPTRFYDYLKAFGIGHRTNIDLAGEKIWPLSLPGDSNWYQVNLATNSFGQGVAVTPLQMAVSISAVANDGNIMAPHIVKAIIQDGKQRDVRPMIIGNPISAQTAHTLSEMLATSLEEESSNALVEGYRIAGKTGTAEIPSPQGYLSDATNASFVGWGPVDDPQFLVYVWLEKPASSPWGSVVAAPVFRDVVKELVVLLNIPPDSIRQQIR